MMGKASRSMHRLGAILLVCFVGTPLTAASLAGGQMSFRSLTVGHQSVRVAKAFGAEDEDCIVVTQPAPRPDRTLHTRKKLVCQA